MATDVGAGDRGSDNWFCHLSRLRIKETMRPIFLIALGLSSCSDNDFAFTYEDISVYDHTEGQEVVWGDFKIATEAVLKARGRGRGTLDILSVEFYDSPPYEGKAGQYDPNGSHIEVQYYPCYEGYVHELCHHLQWWIEHAVDYGDKETGAHHTPPYWNKDGVRDTAEKETQIALGCQ